MSARIVLVSGWSYGVEILAALGEELGRAGIAMDGMEGLDFVDGGEPAGTLAEAAFEGSEPAVLGGWSLGAMLALAAAGRAPEKCAGLVLIGATARFCAGPEQPYGMPEAEVRALGRALRINAESALAGFDALCADPHPPLARDAWPPVETLRTGLEYLRRADVRAEAARWPGPALVLHGECDRVVPVEAARALAGLMPQARLEIFPGIGHDLPRRSPREVARRIAAWQTS